MLNDTVTTPTPIASDRKLIDTVIYLASLASELKEIDPKLDKLREITAAWDQHEPLESDSVSTLQKLVADLKDYLIHRDPLRSFTPESLDERLDRELSGKQKKMPPFLALLTPCVLLSAAIGLLPLHFSGQNQSFIAIATFLVSLVLISCSLYVTSFRNFKPELRSVFIYLCAASGIIGIHFVDYLVIGWLKVANQELFRYGGLTEVPAVAVIVLYIGFVKYAAILKIPMKHIPLQVIGGTAAIVLLTTGATIVRGLPDKLFLGLSLASILFVGYYAALGAILARRILKNVTTSYAKSLRLLYIFELMLPVVALIFAIGVLWVGPIKTGALSVLLAACGTPTMVLFMYSGYSFKRETGR